MAVAGRTDQRGEVNDASLQRIDVTRIKSYERNPRRGANPEYDRIKQSIRDCGMAQPLVITCRPDEAQYTVLAGGNTRLKILQELYAETHDERFRWAPCLLQPWTAEAEVLLAHLRENDLRGSLTFIERACAVVEVRALFEAELGTSLSHRALAEHLRTRGYGATHGLISQFAYAVETLLPVMPRALEGGLGRPSVERLRAFQRATEQIWVDRRLGDPAEYIAVFEALCRRYDDPQWNFDVFAEAMEMELAMAADERLQTIRMEIDRVVKKLPPEQDPASDQGEPRAPTRSRQVDSGLDDAPVQTRGVAEPGGVDDTADIDALRRHARTLATRLAERHGLAELVIPIEGQGIGFLLRDVPSATLVDQLDEAALGQVCTLWWHLAACAEVTVAPLETIVSLLPDTSVLRRALEGNDAALLFDSVWTPDPGQTGDRLWRQLGAEDWQDLIALMETYRRLHAVADATGTALWSRCDGGE